MVKVTSEQTKIVELRPIKETSEDYERLEEKIKKHFKAEIYLPLLAELMREPQRLLNAKSDYPAITEALRTGKITFGNGVFAGKFNAAISKELRSLGARFEKRTAVYRLLKSQLPKDLVAAIDGSAFQYKRKMQKIDDMLAKMLPEEIADKLKISEIFQTALTKTDADFRDSVKAITVQPKLTQVQKERLADEWQNNMRLWIKDFTSEEISKLRKDLRKSVFSGNRYDSAIKTIQKSYGVSENKAKFLARQETSLLMTKFKQVRYEDAGVNEYIWGCVAGSPNHPVRPWHKNLEGKVFKWNTPPITTKPGEPVRRNNPGQDYNCRCFAKPIVRFRK